VDADEPPREVIVDRRRRAGRHDEREEAQRSVVGAIERVLPDAAAHLARLVWLRAALGQPAVSSEQRRERGLQRVDARREIRDRRRQPPRLADQRTTVRRVDEKTVARVARAVMSQIAHPRSIYPLITSRRWATRPGRRSPRRRS